MNPIEAIRDREPVLTLGMVTAAIGLAVILGLDPAVGGGLEIFAGSVLAWLTRSATTPEYAAQLREWEAARVAREDVAS